MSRFAFQQFKHFLISIFGIDSRALYNPPYCRHITVNYNNRKYSLVDFHTLVDTYFINVSLNLTKDFF